MRCGRLRGVDPVAGTHTFFFLRPLGPKIRHDGLLQTVQRGGGLRARAQRVLWEGMRLLGIVTRRSGALWPPPGGGPGGGHSAPEWEGR